MDIQLPEPISLTGPPVNVPLLRKAVEWAEAEAAKPSRERKWWQIAWRDQRQCGTAYCVAGFVVEASGLKWINDYQVEASDGQRVPVPGAAAQLLGITGISADGWINEHNPGEAGALFRASNSIADVREVAERIAARAGERL